MTTELNITQTLSFAIQQIFAESYWEKYIKLKNEFGNNPTEEQKILLKEEYISALEHGNSKKDNILEGGYAKLTKTLAEEAYTNYEVIDYIGNQSAGFSAILLKDIHSGEYTLSFRSTEYKEDFARDAFADTEIADNGFAFGQISEMEKFYQSLITGPNAKILPTEKLNISGYSLGGHLAYSFFVMHKDNVNHVYTQNAAGIGTIGTVGNDDKKFSNYNQQLTNANNRFTSIKDNFLTAIFGSSLANDLTVLNYQQILNSLTYYPNSVLSAGLTGNNKLLADAIALKITNLKSTTLSSKSMQEIYNLFYDGIQQSVLEKEYPNSNVDKNTIYQNSRYKLAISITKNEFNSAALPMFSNLINKFTANDGGSTENAIFDPDFFTTISGKGIEGILGGSDQNIVSTSNLHSERYDVFVEDQNEIVDWMGRIPLLDQATKKLNGDFGNTHSITLLIDSLRAQQVLVNIMPSITLQTSTDILSASSNQYASFHSGFSKSSFLEGLLGGRGKAIESDSISNLIDSLYRIFIKPQVGEPSISEVEFSRYPEYMGDILKREELHIKENLINNYIKTRNLNSLPQLEIKSLYDSLTNQTISSSEILTKALQNNNEGMAYRYALREMNNYVILNLDYSLVGLNNESELNLSKHSALWYKAKAEILVNNIYNNVNNIDFYNGAITGHGQITDKVAYRNLNYQKYGDFIFNIRLTSTAYKDIYVEGKLRNVTIFDTDIPQTIPTSGPPLSQNYVDTKYNDYIFMGNKNNNITLKGGTDTIETGNNNNFINAFSAINSTLNLSLYGNNTVLLGADYKGGTIYYKNQLLTVGLVQSNGTYQDQTYANISYEFTSGSNLKIKYLNVDNTFNTTEIIGYNRTLNQFGLTFNDSPQSYSAPTLIDLTDNVGNPYVNSAFATLTPPPGQLLNLSGIDYDTVMVESPYAYLYKEGGTSYKALTSDLPLFVEKMAPETYTLRAGMPEVKYYRPTDTLLINKNLDIFAYSIARSGDDLVLKGLASNNFSADTVFSTIKNYFKFDHSTGTGIYFRDAAGTALSQVTQAELMRYDVLSGDANNNDINGGNHSTLYGGLGGNDKITSGTQNTTFLTFQGSGSDVLVSGSGNNRFVFAAPVLNETYSVIKNIKSTDKIIFSPVESLSAIVSAPISSVSTALVPF